MIKKIQITLLLIVFTCAPALAGSIAEEHEKAKAGGYEDEYENAMKKYEGTRTKEEHEKYHKEQEQKNNKNDKEEDYGKTYQEKQLGTEGKIRTW